MTRLKETCSMLTKACQSLRNRAREQTAEAEALRVEAEKKREVQARLQELCRAQAQQCKVGTHHRPRRESTAAVSWSRC